MGNTESSHAGDEEPGDLASFPGSALLEKIPCGNINDTHQEGMFGMATRGNLPTPNGSAKSTLQKFFNQAEALCVQSPNSAAETGTARSEFFDDEYEDFAYNKKKDESSSSKKENTPSSSNTPSSLQSEQQQQGGDRQSPAANSSSNNPTSALFARALVNEVTDNPKTMKPAEMAEREKRLLKAQQQAKKMAANQKDGPKPVGAPGGIGKPSVLGSIAHALTGSADGLGNVSGSVENKNGASVLPPNSLSENRAQVGSSSDNNSITVDAPPGKHTITIGLSLSRRHSIGHPDTVTRQTAFDFNELQDREYKYVSSTDSSGWRAGGGERGGPHGFALGEDPTMMDSEEGAQLGTTVPKSTGSGQPPARPSKESQPGTPAGVNYKVAAPDTVHIPIIHIDAESPQAVDMIIAALARGEIFIPHMAILPEALSVNGISPPDLVVRFGTERNDDLPPDEWPNWCLEFMHNQLYEYFQSMGARWMKRPFSITLARKVRWKTVKHMNRYFAHAERVIDAWREKGPQYLDPQLSYIEGGATPEEVSRPHGIYLLRNGVATNYFAPNFDPPYTTKMTRSLLLNVLGKSWNPKRREWTSEPVPKLVTPSLLMATMCGCSDNTAGGFMANEVTMSASDKLGEGRNTSIPAAARSTSTSMDAEDDSAQEPSSKKSATRQPKREPPPQQQRPHDETDADQEDNAARTSTASSSALGSDAAVAEMLSKRGEGSSSAAGSTQRRGVDPDNDEKSESAAKPLGPRSPRAMRAPTPERMDPVGASSRGGAVASNKSDVFQPSVTGTNSTIMHMNLSTENFMKRDMERRQAREEKKEDPDPTVSNDGLPDLMGQQKTGLHASATAQRLNSKGHTSTLEEERARQVALVALAQQQTSSPKKGGSIPNVQRIDSGVSLEYSVDSSIMVGGDSSILGGGSTLLGQHFATDASVNTTSSRGSRRVGTTSQNKMASLLGRHEEGSGDSFSLQEDSSSWDKESVVPTDEDLFAVGWAKAMDPKSGSYYYFTLDRSKIVWDNPLAGSISRRSGDTGDSDDNLPVGAAAI